MAMTILFALLAIGWVAVAVIGTQAYFRGEQTKPIHARNWRSESFEAIALTVTGTETDYASRTPGFGQMDAYNSRLLPDA